MRAFIEVRLLEGVTDLNEFVLRLFEDAFKGKQDLIDFGMNTFLLRGNHRFERVAARPRLQGRQADPGNHGQQKLLNYNSY